MPSIRRNCTTFTPGWDRYDEGLGGVFNCLEQMVAHGNVYVRLRRSLPMFARVYVPLGSLPTELNNISPAVSRHTRESPPNTRSVDGMGAPLVEAARRPPHHTLFLRPVGPAETADPALCCNSVPLCLTGAQSFAAEANGVFERPSAQAVPDVVKCHFNKTNEQTNKQATSKP